ncbi:MAG: formyltransferase [Gammaproteobacteria bacterium]|jgi:methionyl-tRNA formyltransferase
MTRSAAVFAYHDVGCRGLSCILANRIDVELVVTHRDDPGEKIWFGSVAELAALHDIPVVYAEDLEPGELRERLAGADPDWLFSFYYRYMLDRDLLAIPRRGAFNLHGSLLPNYRGRVPVNWAIINGETETGASLHRMETKPDAGALIDQQAVAILPNDTAAEVMRKICCAGEVVLMRSLPKLIDGSFRETPLDLAAGSYFGGRKPEDGRIDWSLPASRLHNLIRALAPPYPPAFFDAGEHRLHLLGSYFRNLPGASPRARLYWSDGRCYADCIDGRRLQVTGLEIDRKAAGQTEFEQLFGAELVP